MAAFYLMAGILHIQSPGGFLAITPNWVPFPLAVVYFTGAAEILGAIGLMIPRAIIDWARPAAGIGLALYAICVYPANINHAVNSISVGGEALGWSYHAPRLLFQPIFIWWALFVGENIIWPFKPKA